MNKKFLLLIFAFFIHQFSSSAQEIEKEDKANYFSFNAQIFADKFKPGAQLLDVRSEKEFKAGHLKGAILIPLSEANFAEKIKTLNKQNALFLYASTPSESVSAAETLANSGFIHVYYLTGAYQDLVKQGMPVVK